MYVRPPSRTAVWTLVGLTGLFTGPAFAGTVFDAGSNTVWRFNDTGTAPPAGWTALDFDDSGWRSGAAPLGFGETRVGTEVSSDKKQAVTTWFRHTFVAPPLATNERAVIVLSVDDGAVIHLNGRELARVNMGRGKVTPSSLASREVGARSEGMYVRVPVPPKTVRGSATNVLAVEVHQATTNNADLFFDLALKTVPPDTGPPTVTPDARVVLESYLKNHYVGPEARVPDGYLDGGRHMKLNARGQAASGREILLVDRPHDPELRKEIEFARSPELRGLPELERVQRLAAYVDQRTTPPGGERWTGPTVETLTREFENKTLRIGDVVEQSQAGVCRHRSLLFKILADEAGLKASLVRGNYAVRGQKPGFAHAWNEVELTDGQRLLVDVMHNGGKPKFPAVTSPNVVRFYLKEDDTPWYRTNATPKTVEAGK